MPQRLPRASASRASMPGPLTTRVGTFGRDACALMWVQGAPTCWPESSREEMPRRLVRSSFSSALTVSSACSRSRSALPTACAPSRILHSPSCSM